MSRSFTPCRPKLSPSCVPRAFPRTASTPATPDTEIMRLKTQLEERTALLEALQQEKADLSNKFMAVIQSKDAVITELCASVGASADVRDTAVVDLMKRNADLKVQVATLSVEAKAQETLTRRVGSIKARVNHLEGIIRSTGDPDVAVAAGVAGVKRSTKKRGRATTPARTRTPTHTRTRTRSPIHIKTNRVRVVVKARRTLALGSRRTGATGSAVPTYNYANRFTVPFDRQVCSIAVSKVGEVAVATYDGEVTVFSSGARRVLRRMDHGSVVWALASLPDGTLVSAGGGHGKKGTIKLWNEDGECVREIFAAHDDAVSCLAVLESASADGLLFASGSDDCTVKLWDTETAPYVLKGHTGYVNCLASLCDGRVASGGDDGLVKVWWLNVCQYTLDGHVGAVWSITSLPNGCLATGGQDKAIRVWDGTTMIRKHEGHTDTVSSLTCLRDNTIVSGGWDRTIKLWKSSGCIESITGHSGGVRALASLPDGALMSGGKDHTLRVWRRTGKIKSLK